LVVSTLASLAALAVEPDEILADPAQEARARKLDQELRCVVCQSQSLAESNAPLAKDMRVLLREQIAGGASNDEAVAFLVDRYGEYVLLKPRLKASTVLLWTIPATTVGLGAIIAALYLQSRRKTVEPTQLDATEQARLDDILEGRR
jgi:cytochrome c-type biogenesis protein CcmH